jgi:hypothetical protein
MALERLVVDSDDSSIATPVIRDTATGAFVVDYSDYMLRITNAVESLALNSADIKDNTLSIANSLTTGSTSVASILSGIESHINEILKLGEGSGFHVIGPYDWLGLINVYRSLVEQGNIMDTDGNVSEEEQAEALAKIADYISKLQAIPPGF